MNSDTNKIHISSVLKKKLFFDNRGINDVINFLSKKASYIFGSSVINILLDRDIDTDIDMLFDMGEKNIIPLLNEFEYIHISNGTTSRSKFTEKYASIVQSEEQSFELYECFVRKFNPVIKFEDCSQDNFLKFDLVFVVNVNKFIKNLSDFDNSMIVYNLEKQIYEVAGNSYDTGLGVFCKRPDDSVLHFFAKNDGEKIKKILKNHIDKKIKCNFIKNLEIKTTFYRFIRLIDNGFTINLEKTKNADLVVELFNKSFCLEDDENLPKHQKLFLQNCVSEKYIDILKMAYTKSIIPMDNIYISNFIAYCLELGHFDYAKNTVEKFSKNFPIPTLKYIPLILKKRYTIDAFIDFYETIKIKFLNLMLIDGETLKFNTPYFNFKNELLTCIKYSYGEMSLPDIFILETIDHYVLGYDDGEKNSLEFYDSLCEACEDFKNEKTKELTNDLDAIVKNLDTIEKIIMLNSCVNVDTVNTNDAMEHVNLFSSSKLSHNPFYLLSVDVDTDNVMEYISLCFSSNLLHNPFYLLFKYPELIKMFNSLDKSTRDKIVFSERFVCNGDKNLIDIYSKSVAKKKFVFSDFLMIIKYSKTRMLYEINTLTTLDYFIMLKNMFNFDFSFCSSGIKLYAEFIKDCIFDKKFDIIAYIFISHGILWPESISKYLDLFDSSLVFTFDYYVNGEKYFVADKSKITEIKKTILSNEILKMSVHFDTELYTTFLISFCDKLLKKLTKINKYKLCIDYDFVLSDHETKTIADVEKKLKRLYNYLGITLEHIYRFIVYNVAKDKYKDLLIDMRSFSTMSIPTIS